MPLTQINWLLSSSMVSLAVGIESLAHNVSESFDNSLYRV